MIVGSQPDHNGLDGPDDGACSKLAVPQVQNIEDQDNDRRDHSDNAILPELGASVINQRIHLSEIGCVKEQKTAHDTQNANVKTARNLSKSEQAERFKEPAKHCAADSENNHTGI